MSLTPEQLRSQSWQLVQNVVDVLPDDVTRFVRQALADDRPEQALSALVFACVQLATTLNTVEHAVLAECLLAVDEDASLLDHVTVGDVERPVLFEFTDLPRSAAELLDEGAGVLGGGSDDTEAVIAAARAIDRAVTDRCGAPTAALGVWRAWRYPLNGAPWPRPTPVYLVEARDATSALEVVTAFYGQGLCLVSGEPIVEVYPTGSELPPLHRAVQFAGELVFAASQPPAFSFADVFDGALDASGLTRAVTRVSEEEAARLAAYLLSGTPMLVADTYGEDVLDPSRGQGVPLHLRTDGRWIWSDASVYYLREHRVAPPPAFYAHLQTAASVAPRVDDVTLHQAVAWLQSG